MSCPYCGCDSTVDVTTLGELSMGYRGRVCCRCGEHWLVAEWDTEWHGKGSVVRNADFAREILHDSMENTMKPKTETGKKIDDAVNHVGMRIGNGVLIMLPAIIIVIIIAALIA